MPLNLQHKGECFICHCQSFHMGLIQKIAMSPSICIIIEIKNHPGHCRELNCSKLKKKNKWNGTQLKRLIASYLLQSVEYSFHHCADLDWCVGQVVHYFHNDAFALVKFTVCHTSWSIKQKDKVYRLLPTSWRKAPNVSGKSGHLVGASQQQQVAGMLSHPPTNCTLGVLLRGETFCSGAIL